MVTPTYQNFHLYPHPSDRVPIRFRVYVLNCHVYSCGGFWTRPTTFYSSTPTHRACGGRWAVALRGSPGHIDWSTETCLRRRFTRFTGRLPVRERTQQGSWFIYCFLVSVKRHHLRSREGVKTKSSRTHFWPLWRQACKIMNLQLVA